MASLPAALASATAQRPAATRPPPHQRPARSATSQYSRQCRKRNVAPCRCDATAQAAAAPAPQVAATDQQVAFAELSASNLATCSVAVQPWSAGPGSVHTPGLGLFMTATAAAGDVVLSVPMSLCLAVDYASTSGGLALPAGSWPRVQRGILKDDALPWDVLLALALLDSLSGSGDAFWERYANSILPQPTDLTLPLCFPPELLPELQHAALVEGAAAQQERLSTLFPGLSGSMCEGGPSWLQWAFGCVRSRAFKLRDECFACVPYLDVANHHHDPSCDFRLNEQAGAVELVALRELQPGQEATISYTGAAGMTSQRLMAQYGFTPAGNPADRLQFGAAAASFDPAAVAHGAVVAVDGSGDGEAPVLLSLDRMMACLGSDDRVAAAMSGRDSFAYAALKSLPFAAEEGSAAPLSLQLSLAERLHAELEAEAAGWPTSISHDSALVQEWAAVGGGGGGGADSRLVAAVDYRLKRKALVTTCRQLLLDFMDHAPVDGI
ncbi:hypothetical protein D9Q98_005821 [Chlorella vulgaris]|uniref:SET domain-containing protein n=1 Tax=Chlorella vulgaris TaxID=3077 RepID=A0A9D4TWA9_CHLVU|nr:hypothetical protein D9Q98_005821 [Chlorella vulgaris]